MRETNLPVAEPIPGRTARPERLRPLDQLAAFGALFGLAVRQHCRARRLLILAFLFTLPAVVAILVRTLAPILFPHDLQTCAALTLVRAPVALAGPLYASRLVLMLHEVEFALLFTLIPHALLPLTALLYASGMIQDEVEEQTLTYLLVRPTPKWAIYLAKFLATLLVTAVLASLFTAITCVALFWGTPGFTVPLLVPRVLKVAALFALALVSYCAVFGCMSLFARRSLVVGVAYIIVFEGVLANIDFAVRRLTVMYYFRVLAERWLDLRNPEWSLDLAQAPDLGACVQILAAASVLLTAVAALAFTMREFRLKTPEGS
jgi:ABC-2 type transport system permease protein